MSKDDAITRIINELIHFRQQRDWEQFHNPKDLAIALNIESSELLESFLWNYQSPPAYLKNWSVYWSDTINIFCSKYLL